MCGGGGIPEHCYCYGDLKYLAQHDVAQGGSCEILTGCPGIPIWAQVALSHDPEVT